MKKIIALLTFIFLLFAGLLSALVWVLYSMFPAIFINTPLEADLDEDRIYSIIQDMRKEQGRTPYEEHRYLCGWAEERAEEVRTEQSHDGFMREYAKAYEQVPFKMLSENVALSGTGEWQVVGGWYASTEHREALEADYKYSCLRCNRSFCVQLFAN